MTLQVYSTLERRKVPFEPIEPGKVRMYVCGPTVYDSSHIGHARSVVVFDVIARYLREAGYAVTYVRNFTDVDDKIIHKANQLGTRSELVAERFIAEFYRDMDALNVMRATFEPRATEHIGGIIALIQTLLDKGAAYVLEGDVYFAVERFAEYGKLSGRRLEEMEAGARVEVDGRKRNPFDFALWKAAKPGEPAWESPWGKGRPGWHIECSAMSRALLGESFDIHGGGKDLVFPHHENEIAQSEAANGKPFARYWLHNGFVNINHEKMSKSLGNFLVIHDVLQNHPAEAVRLFLLSSHYRSPVDYTPEALAESTTALEKIYALLLRLEESGAPPPPGGEETAAVEPSNLWRRFREAMDDDFNTARALGALFDGVRLGNRLLDDGSPGAMGEARQLQPVLQRMGAVLGLLAEPPRRFMENRRQQALARMRPPDRERIEALVAERSAARRAKDWRRADEIRLRLEEMAVLIEDRADGTLWKLR
jgi:cysteinyl-tRNA synthetase